MADNDTKILFAHEDKSINRVKRFESLNSGIIETRIVQRDPEVMIIYLSTHTGCSNSCRFCHLTQTNQTSNVFVDKDGYVDQMDWVISQLIGDTRVCKVKTVHINFMARGDGLSSPFFMLNTTSIFNMIRSKIRTLFGDGNIKFKISTIFPKDNIFKESKLGMKYWLDYSLIGEYFGEIECYYSLYSLDDKFRKRWLPKAQSPDYVGNLFRGSRPLNNFSNFRLHHALISSENDSLEDVAAIHRWLDTYDITCPMNIVRYNPYDESCGEESGEDKMNIYIDAMRQSPRISVLQVIPKVGFSVKASCGMFVLDDSV